MATTARDFASAGASAAMRDKGHSKAGLHLVKTVSRASESAKDHYDPSVSITQQVRAVRKPSVIAERPAVADLTPEQQAFETVNYVLSTLGNRLGSAGLVSLPSLDRALTSATAAVLFSAEASPLFESLRNQAHDLVLVNSVFCAIYFVGFVTARLAGTLPHYKATYTPLGSKVIQQLFHAAIGEEATNNDYEAKQTAYRTLTTATGLLQPTNSGPGIFPGFPVLKPSAFSPTGFLTQRENKNLMEKLIQHFTKHGFPQPLSEEELQVQERGRERPAPEPIHIKDWRFLTGDDNSKSYDVAHADKHIGENFGRVLYWLICSAYRLGPGQAVIVYHQQHIQLVRWLGNRFGFKILGMATDLDWSGKHFDVNPKLKSMTREWLVIVPAPKSPRHKKRSSKRLSTQDGKSPLQRPPSSSSTAQYARPSSSETDNAQHRARAAHFNQLRRSIRPGRSVSFAEHKPAEFDRESSGSSGMHSLQRVRTEPLKSAMRGSRDLKNDSPPRPHRPAAEDIPDMDEVNKRTGEVPRPPSLGSNSLSRSQSHRSVREELGQISTENRSKRASYAGSPKPLSPGAGLPPFVSDMTNARTSPVGSQRSSKEYSSSDIVAEPVSPVDDPVSPRESALPTDGPLAAQQDDHVVLKTEENASNALHRTNTVSSNGDLSRLPGALYVMQTEKPSVPPIPSKSPRRMSPSSSPTEEKTANQLRQAALEQEYYDEPAKVEHVTPSSVLTKPHIDTSGATLSGSGDFSQLSPQMAAHWDNDGQHSFTGLSDALIHSRRGSQDGVQAPAVAAAPAFVTDTGHDATTPKAQTAFNVPAPVQQDHPEVSHHHADSNVSFVSAAPSWPSSIASLPSSIPDTPTHDAFRDPSTAATSTSNLGTDANSKARRKAPPPPQKPVPAVAVFDFTTEELDEELPFSAGDQLEVIEQDPELEEDGWCRARLNGKTGLVPLSYIKFQPESTKTPSEITATQSTIRPESSAGDDAVSLWSGFNQVIGWTRFASRDHASASSAVLNPAISWIDVDADEFDYETAHSVTMQSPATFPAVAGTAMPPGSKITPRSGLADTDILNLHDPARLATTLEESLFSGGAASQFDSASIAGSAAPAPLFTGSRIREHSAFQEDDTHATPKPHHGPHNSEDYFEPAYSISGETEISESESRIASFDARPPPSPTVVANVSTESLSPPTNPTVGPAPRFWDDVSGGLSAIGSSKGEGSVVPSSDSGDAATVVGAENEGEPAQTPRLAAADVAPRFWDDVSGGMGAQPNPDGGCRQS